MTASPVLRRDTCTLCLDHLELRIGALPLRITKVVKREISKKKINSFLLPSHLCRASDHNYTRSRSCKTQRENHMLSRSTVGRKSLFAASTREIQSYGDPILDEEASAEAASRALIVDDESIDFVTISELLEKDLQFVHILRSENVSRYWTAHEEERAMLAIVVDWDEALRAARKREDTMTSRVEAEETTDRLSVEENELSSRDSTTQQECGDFLQLRASNNTTPSQTQPAFTPSPPRGKDGSDRSNQAPREKQVLQKRAIVVPNVADPSLELLRTIERMEVLFRDSLRGLADESARTLSEYHTQFCRQQREHQRLSVLFDAEIAMTCVFTDYLRCAAAATAIIEGTWRALIEMEANAPWGFFVSSEQRSFLSNKGLELKRILLEEQSLKDNEVNDEYLQFSKAKALTHEIGLLERSHTEALIELLRGEREGFNVIATNFLVAHSAAYQSFAGVLVDRDAAGKVHRWNVNTWTGIYLAEEERRGEVAGAEQSSRTAIQLAARHCGLPAL